MHIIKDKETKIYTQSSYIFTGYYLISVKLIFFLASSPWNKKYQEVAIRRNN